MTFRFRGRAAAADPTGYFHVRWDQAQKVSCLADTRAQATAKAIAMLGTSRLGNFLQPGWAIIWDQIDEETPGPRADYDAAKEVMGHE